MLDRAHIQHFQSLHDADIELGKFTVLVGPSNSGKSAFVRALRVFAYNAHNPSFVTHGAKASRIAVQMGDPEDGGGHIVLERGKLLSTYRIIGPGDTEEVYAKCGRNVPDDIRNALGFVEIEGDTLNFAGQFDKPFLLDEPATKVAKVLGDLTNINVLYEAVREANRRRLDVSGRLKVRRGDLDTYVAQLQAYKTLPQRQKAMTAAREAYECSVNISGEIQQLSRVVTSVTTEQAALEHLAEQSTKDVSVDVAGLEAQLERVVALRRLVEDVVHLAPQLKSALSDVESIAAEITSLDEDYHTTLKEAGKCPVCGQEVA